jgi:hypothetical protein
MVLDFIGFVVRLVFSASPAARELPSPHALTPRRRGRKDFRGVPTVDQRVAAEKQNGVGTAYIPPMARRLKSRIDPEQSPYTCMAAEA